jgi:hypothetical protein
MNRSLGSFGRYGDWLDDISFQPYSETQAQDKKKKQEQGAAIAGTILNMVGQGVNLFSSFQDRKGAEANAQAEIARATAAGQMSAAQARIAEAQVASQLGLSQTGVQTSQMSQETWLILGIGGLLTVGVLGALALSTGRRN